MDSRLTASSFIFIIFTSMALSPIYACGYCPQPPFHKYPPKASHPPHGKRPPSPPVIISPPVITPPITNPPPSGAPPLTRPPPPAQPTCPVDALKLGLCADVLGGLIHVGVGDPAVNTCCPVLQGLLELEAAICLCTTIRLKLLNLNIFLPLALQLLITCGKTPPPGFTCPPL